jgi:hypothetical protein
MQLETPQSTDHMHADLLSNHIACRTMSMYRAARWR